jgi:hypothetical protein
MNTARNVVLTIAVGAGGVAACPARGSDTKPARAKPVRRNERPDATGLIAGSIARAFSTPTMTQK